MSSISTHVLDAVLGKPAPGISVRLEMLQDNGWVPRASGVTDPDGRCRGLAAEAAAGTYRFTFAVGNYFESSGRASIYPEIAITFQIDGAQNYHLPLLLSDNSYTTYRGS
jgi:5-hydroxyisourate hydrolase